MHKDDFHVNNFCNQNKWIVKDRLPLSLCSSGDSLFISDHYVWQVSEFSCYLLLDSH